MFGITLVTWQCVLKRKRLILPRYQNKTLPSGTGVPKWDPSSNKCITTVTHLMSYNQFQLSLRNLSVIIKYQNLQVIHLKLIRFRLSLCNSITLIEYMYIPVCFLGRKGKFMVHSHYLWVVPMEMYHKQQMWATSVFSTGVENTRAKACLTVYIICLFHLAHHFPFSIGNIIFIWNGAEQDKGEGAICSKEVSEAASQRSRRNWKIKWSVQRKLKK